ncbi:WD domain, G-beta repeat protein [Aphelenchoides bicaudatus]|nr:WD domain, G-beta repeat protein [Aphelenchoides bicaudatus]
MATESSMNPPERSDRALYNSVFRSMKRAHDMFAHDRDKFIETESNADKIWKAAKTRSDYGHVLNAAKEAKRKKAQQTLNLPENQRSGIETVVNKEHNKMLSITGGTATSNTAVSTINPKAKADDSSVRALLPSKASLLVKPTWHAPWKLYRVISGHTGWVRAVDVEPNNEWFATGGADRIIKIWDMASGKLKLSLTGHISSVRALKISTRHPYLFSGGEDKQVKCWDLEQNKVVRHYHGHLSAIQDMALHPVLDLLITTSRDSTARVWDMRTKAQVFCLGGHTNTVAAVVCQANDPQVITGSHDSTIRLWDLAAGRSVCTLTNHKKSVRSLVLHPTLDMFASGSTDNIKQWQSHQGIFYQNLAGHNSMINAMAVNDDGVLVSGGDNGTMHFWDWSSGFCFQREHPPPQPGSIDSESGIYSMTFDKSGTRLITAESDKSIKMWKEDPEATEETHPIIWRPELLKKQRT